jgi:hypothetical protein
VDGASGVLQTDDRWPSPVQPGAPFCGWGRRTGGKSVFSM